MLSKLSTKRLTSLHPAGRSGGNKPEYIPDGHKMKTDLRGCLAEGKEAGSAHSRNYVRVLLTRHCVKQTAKRLRFMPTGSIAGVYKLRLNKTVRLVFAKVNTIDCIT